MQEKAKDGNEAKKNFWFFLVFGILLFSSVVASFLRYYVFKDYQIVAQVSCDPVTEKCFQIECDPETETSCVTKTDGASVSYYKIISKRASNILACESSVEKLGCTEEISCVLGEQQCLYEYCSNENLEEGVECSDSNE